MGVDLDVLSEMDGEEVLDLERISETALAVGGEQVLERIILFNNEFFVVKLAVQGNVCYIVVLFLFSARQWKGRRTACIAVET